MAGKFFDEWVVGERIEHEIRRTVTETDNLLFSTMTHNPQPLHLDVEFASKTEFGKPLVNSCLTLSIVVGMSEAQIALVERSGKVQPRLAIVAPVSGVVAELGIREGMTVTPGMTLFRINGLDSVWVNAEVPESMAAQVRPGSRVEATSSTWPGKVFTGRVSALLPEVDMTTRTLKARIELANPNAELVPGMFASLHLAGAVHANALLVPAEAVIRTGQRSVVFTVDQVGSFHPVNVSTGREREGEVEILSGLELGQKVVVSGQFLVDSEASLKGVSSRMQADDMPAGMDGKMDMRGMSQ